MLAATKFGPPNCLMLVSKSCKRTHTDCGKILQVAKPTTISALPAASVEDIQDAALDGEAAGLLENELAKQMEAEAIVSPAETRKGTAAKAFQRVKADEWMNSKAARNNSYEANFGNQGWGAKAQEVLGQVNLVTLRVLSSFMEDKQFPIVWCLPSNPSCMHLAPHPCKSRIYLSFGH